MFVERYPLNVILQRITTSNEGMLNSEPFLQWIRYSESSWYPARGQEHARRSQGWRCAIGWDSEACPDAFTIQQFQGVIHHKSEIIHWPRCHYLDYVIQDANIQWCFLPETIEVDERLLNIEMHSLDDNSYVQCFIDEEPREQWDVGIFDIQLQWDDQGASLQINVDLTTTAIWKIYSGGKWSSMPIAILDSGVHNIRVEPPIGDIVYLHVEGAGTYKHVHRMHVVGRPGIASGRYIWHRGMLYHPKGCKTQPWVSAIIPVFHLSDIERFPRNSKINQQQWWVEEASWTEEAIALIKEQQPLADIIRMGSLNNPGDVVILKPYELSNDLPPENLYAVNLFSNSGEEPFGQQAAWLIEKLRSPALQHIRFVERSWLAALGAYSNSDGAAQYGFGFAFTRMPEHEHLWGSAVRNIIFREEKESLPCQGCLHKSSCKQLLPTSFLPNQKIPLDIPWPSLLENKCIVQKWFS